MPTLTFRDAAQADAPTIIDLLDQLGWSKYVRERVSVAYIRHYLEFPYNTILLAETPPGEPNLGSGTRRQTVGLLAYSIRPDLYHVGDACLLENFVVREDHRNQGIGSALIEHLLDRLYKAKCVTLFVDVEADNLRAIRFYRRHGLDQQVLLLERHL